VAVRPDVEWRTTGRSSWWRRRRCPLNSSTSRGRRSNPSSALDFPGWPDHRDTSAYTSFPTDSFRFDSWDPRHLRWPTPMSDRLPPRRPTRRLTSRTAKNGTAIPFVGRRPAGVACAVKYRRRGLLPIPTTMPAGRPVSAALPRYRRTARAHHRSTVAPSPRKTRRLPVWSPRRWLRSNQGSRDRWNGKRA
jgi:hypothetical protein